MIDPRPDIAGNLTSLCSCSFQQVNRLRLYIDIYMIYRHVIFGEVWSVVQLLVLNESIMLKDSHIVMPMYYRLACGRVSSWVVLPLWSLHLQRRSALLLRRDHVLPEVWGRDTGRRAR